MNVETIMRTITAIETGKDWTLKVIFGDGALRIFDFSPP